MLSFVPEFLIRYVQAGWRHRWLGMAVAWLVCLAGWVVVYTMPSQYQSSARLYAEVDAILGQTLRGIAVDGAPQAQVELLARTLLSRPNLERVVARTDLDNRVRSVAEREALIDSLARRVRIGAQGRALYSISFTDTDPRVAQAVVRTLLDLFMERAASNDRQQMQNATNFINQQIAAYEAQLREAEQRRAEFRTRFMDLLPSDARGGVTRLEQSRQQLESLNGQLADIRLRRDHLVQQRDALPATIPAAQAAAAGGGGGQLAEAERRLRELRLTLTDQHPDVVRQLRIISDLRAGGGGGDAPRPAATPRPATPAGGQVPNPAREPIQTRITEVEFNIASLERQVREEQADVERLEAMARGAPQLQLQFNNLDRDYNVMRSQYQQLLQRRESLQLAGAARTGADQVRLEVIEPPTSPRNPTGPNRFLFATMVLLGGLGAGAGIAVLLALLDRGFYTMRDLRQIGLPVLGAVSLVNPPNRLVPTAAFAMVAMVLGGLYGAMLLRGTELVARASSLVTRMIT